MLLDITAAKHTPWIHVFETCKHIDGRFTDDLYHQVHAAAMTHRDNQFFGSTFPRALEDFIQQRDEGGCPFKREALAALIASMQDFLE